MTMTKKALGVFLTLFMIVQCFALAVSAEDFDESFAKLSSLIEDFEALEPKEYGYFGYEQIRDYSCADAKALLERAQEPDTDVTADDLDFAARSFESDMGDYLEKLDFTGRDDALARFAEYEYKRSQYPYEVWEEAGVDYALADLTGPIEYGNGFADQSELDSKVAAMIDAFDKLDEYVPVNRDELENVLFEAENFYNESDYTSDSWAAFIDALNTARSVFEDDSAGQDEIDIACSDLIDAKDGLKRIADYSLLDALIEEIGDPWDEVYEKYTTDSISDLDEALCDATDVERDLSEDAQDLIDSAYDKLLAAYNALDLHADMTELIEIVSEAENAPYDQYTYDVWETLGDLVWVVNTYYISYPGDYSASEQDLVDEMVDQLRAALDNKADLTAAIEARNAFGDLWYKDYTEESWDIAVDANGRLYAILRNTYEYFQEDIDEATAALVAAIANLKHPIDTGALEAVISEFAALDESNYTADSWAAAQVAYIAAQTALTDAADQSEIDAAAAALETAIDNLTLFTPFFRFISKSLALDSTLAFRFRGELLGAEHDEDAYMEFIIGDNIRTETMKLSDAIVDGGTVIFTCHLNVLEVNEKITLVFHDGGKTMTRANPITVDEYLEQVKALRTAGTGNAEEDALILDLIEAIYNYTYYAQAALDASHSEYTVGEGGDYQTAKQSDNSVTLLDTDAVEAFKLEKTVEDGYTLVNGTSCTLVLDAETSIVLYLEVEDGHVPSVKVNGKAVEATLLTDGRYQVVISGIMAHQLTRTFKVNIDDGKIVINNLSALTYAYLVYNGGVSAETETAFQYAVSAMYEYCLATQAARDAQ